MPQIFDQVRELMLVDWNTIVIYTCSSNRCYPDGGNGYLADFAFIQFSDDFSRV